MAGIVLRGNVRGKLKFWPSAADGGVGAFHRLKRVGKNIQVIENTNGVLDFHRGNPDVYSRRTAGLGTLKELCCGSPHSTCMRYFRFAVALTLACGLAVPSSAFAAHRRHRVRHTVKIKERKVKAHNGRVPVGSIEAREAVKRNKRMHEKTSHPHGVAEHMSRHPETEYRDVAETIPPIPMRGGRLYVPPPLVGSLASLERQNRRDNAEGLSRIRDTAQLNEMRRAGELVAIPVSTGLRVSPQLPVDRRCTRPWTSKFLADLSHAHYVRFERSLQVTSAVRTVAYQRRLIRMNGNAAPATGDIASPHLSGATIDIAKKGLSLSEIAWMRAYLLPLQAAGKIDVEEEFYQSCFHITVYKAYMPESQQEHRMPTALLAAGVR